MRCSNGGAIDTTQAQAAGRWLTNLVPSADVRRAAALSAVRPSGRARFDRISPPEVARVTLRVALCDTHIKQCVGSGLCPIMARLAELLRKRFVASCSPALLHVFDAETFEQLAQCELHKEARLFVAQCDNGLRPDAFEFDLTAPARFFRPQVIADNALRPRALPDVEAVVVLSFDG